MTNIANLETNTVLRHRTSSRLTRDFEVRPIFKAAVFNSKAFAPKHLHSLGGGI